ncbi:MAG: trehalase family glycosidase [Armatimonadota bacterium]|nr:trehalase family glycosidase [Armatimonadota bacterium]
MASERIISIPNKSHLSNYGSKLVLNVIGPGLRDIHYASGRLARGQKPHAHLVLVKDNGEVVQAKRVSLNWTPYQIQAEFEFPDGLRVIQRSWVDTPFVHSAITFKGALPAGAKLAAQGVSYQEAKVFVTPRKTVMLEEMDPAFKPFVLEIASTVTPNTVQLSVDGKNWKDADFEWSRELVHYRMIFDRLPRQMILSAHLGKLSNPISVKDWQRSIGRERAVKREWLRAYDEEFPDVDCPDERIRRLMQYCFYVHRSGVFTLEGMLPYPFVAPSKITYPAWWMWDTAFHSIVDAWMKDPSVAFGDLLNHTILQTRKGCIQDAAGEYYADTGVLKWVHPEQYDNNPPPSTGPCVTGIAVWDVYQKTGSLDFVKRIYPHLVIYEDWLIKEKPSKLDPDLIAYHNWCDVGWDDSKRWGKSGMSDMKDAVDWDLPVIPVDGNVFLLILRDILSKLSDLLGDTERRREYAEKAARTRRAIDQRMWNEQEGFYFDILPDGKMLSVWSPAGFVPLLAGIPGTDTYQRLREHLLDPKKFWAKYPLPTLSLDDEHFSNTNWWRGAMWPVINWQVNEGVFKYDKELGLRLLMATIDAMTKDGYPTCAEHYNPVQGKGGGAVDQGWAAMPADLILRRIYGIIAKPDSVELNPYLPADWPEAFVRNVFVAGTSIELHYVRSGSALKAAVKNTGHQKDITITSGAKRLVLAPGVEGMIEIGS